MRPSDQEFLQLARQVRRWKAVTTALLVACCSFVLLGFARDGEESATFEELTVGRLNVAGPDGVQRIVLAHEMPQAPFQGKLLERSVPPGLAGMIFCAPNGDEIGGIGASAGHSLLTLDYRDTPLEAIGFVQRRGPNGQSAGMVLMDNPTGTVDIDAINAGDEAEVRRLQGMMVARGWLGVEGHDASLVLRDRQGRPRIVLGVDGEDRPRLRFLDAEGAPVLQLPAE